MIKIEIKHFLTGLILFEYSKEDNSIKDTLIEAIKNKKDLRGADLRGADLRGSYLHGVDLQDYKLKKAIVFTGLYKYIAIPFITEKDEIYIMLGCYTRLLSEWESDFWNNEKEFPNNNSIDSQLRVMAYETCKKWLEINK